MGWTDPNTAVAGDPWSASDYNTYLRDNLKYVHNGKPVAQIVREGVADYAVTVATWSTVDDTNLKITLSVTTGRVRVEASFRAAADNTASSKGEFDLEVDGATRIGGTSGMAAIMQNREAQVTLTGVFTGLAPGSHVFRLKYRNATAGAAVTIYNNAWPIIFLAYEL